MKSVVNNAPYDISGDNIEYHRNSLYNGGDGSAADNVQGDQYTEIL